jgi:hypothetical protein
MLKNLINTIIFTNSEDMSPEGKIICFKSRLQT